MLGAAYTQAMGYDPALSASVSSPGSAGQSYDYASAIDPALESSGPPQSAPSNLFTQPGMSLS